MSATEPEAPSGSALRLVLTAERLFALHGIDGVSLRQIAVESGSANNSAVHYHFGSKDGLVDAILRHRLPQLLRERELLAAQSDPSDVRARFGAHYLPLLHMAESPENRYVTFIEQLQRRVLAGGTDALSLPSEGQRSDEAFRTDLMALLQEVDEEARWTRVVGAQLLCLHAAVDREHAVASGTAIDRFDLFVSALLDGITGFLTAPVSAGTMSRMRGADGPVPPSLQLL